MATKQTGSMKVSTAAAKRKVGASEESENVDLLTTSSEVNSEERNENESVTEDSSEQTLQIPSTSVDVHERILQQMDAMDIDQVQSNCSNHDTSEHILKWLRAAIEDVIGKTVRSGPKKDKQMLQFTSALDDLKVNINEMKTKHSEWEMLGKDITSVVGILQCWKDLQNILRVSESQMVNEVRELVDKCAVAEEIVEQACNIIGIEMGRSAQTGGNKLIAKLMEVFQNVDAVANKDGSVSGVGANGQAAVQAQPGGAGHTTDLAGEVFEYKRIEKRTRVNNPLLKNDMTKAKWETSEQQLKVQDIPYRAVPWMKDCVNWDSSHHQTKEFRGQFYYDNDNECSVREQCNSSVGSSSSSKVPVFTDKAQSLGLLKTLDNFVGDRDDMKLEDYVTSFLMRFPKTLWDDSELVWLFSEKLRGKAKEYFGLLSSTDKTNFDSMVLALKRQLKGENAMNRVQSAMKFNSLRFDMKFQQFSKFIRLFEKLAEQANPELPPVVRKKTMGNRLYDILMSSGWDNMDQMTRIVMDGEGNEYDRMKKLALDLELMQEASKITKQVMNEKNSGTAARSSPRNTNIPLSNDQCGYCGKLGHWKRDCRMRMREMGEQRSTFVSTSNSDRPFNGNKNGGNGTTGGTAQTRLGTGNYQRGVHAATGNFNSRFQPQSNMNRSGFGNSAGQIASGGNAQPLGTDARQRQGQWSNRMVRIEDSNVSEVIHQETKNGIVTGSSPLIEVDILGAKTLALVDSGAQVSTIAKDFLDELIKRKLDVKGGITDLVEARMGQIFDASGNPIGHEGLKKIKIRVCASGIESDVVFYVVKYAPQGEPVLLGTNALAVLGVELILRNDKGEGVVIETKDKYGDSEDFGISKPSELHKVKVHTRVLVRPNEVQPLILKVEGANAKEVTMWSQNENKVASGLAEVDSEGNMVVLVHNSKSEPMIFQQNEEIGEWEAVGSDDRWRKADDESWDMLDLVIDRHELRGQERVEKLKEVIGSGKLPQSVNTLIEKYESIFALYDSELTSTHVVEHDIDTSGAVPLKQRARPVPVGARTQFKELMKGLLDRGIVEKSSSPWASPIVLVVKKDGTLRLCIDYRELNKKIKLDSFPLPRIDEMIQTLIGKKVFSSLDLHSGFWQIKLTKEAREITAFTTTEGLYQFKVLPFGLATSPAVFQRLMAGVLEGLNVAENEVQVYIDDILIATDTVERHMIVLEEVFKALSNAGLCLKPSKCELLKDEVRYLGHILTGRGVEADPDKIKAVVAFPVPKDVGQLRSFLGLCGYYRKFVLGFSKIAKPLTELTSKSVPFHWNIEQEAAFQKLKDVMSSAPVLAQPDFIKAQSGENPFILFTDACKEGVGGVLCQKGIDGFLHPLYFISKGLTKAEKRYTITDLEGLAVVHAVQRLQSVLYNMHFVVKTDHQPLTAFFKTGKNDRVLRWALALQAYGQKMKIEYVPGKENVVADALSRCRRETVSLQLTCGGEPENFLVGKLMVKQLCEDSEWLKELRQDNEYKKIIESVEAGEKGFCKLSRVQKRMRVEDFTIEEGFLWFIDLQGVRKKVIPKSVREKLYEEAHSGVFAGHFSAKKVCEMLKKSYFWEGLPGDVAKWHQKCTKCYLVNSKGVNTPPLKPIVKGKPFELVGVDLLDLGLTESGNKYALVLVDSFSKWMGAYPIGSKTAEEVAETIVSRWICDGARWPLQFLSDMGAEFMNKVMDQVKKVMGIDWVTTKGYNPRENGLVERANSTIIRALKKKMVAGIEWDKLLPFIVYSYNTTYHSSTNESPYFLLHGIDPPSVVSCDVPEVSKYIADVEDYRTVLVEGVRIAREMARECMEREMSRVKEYYDKMNNVDRKWKPRVGDRVYVKKPENQLRNKLDIGYSGPMRVVDVSDNSASVVDLKGKSEPAKLPFDWMMRVPDELSNEQVDNVVVRGRRGRPKTRGVNRITFSTVPEDWTPKMSMDYACEGERILHNKIRRARTKPCDMFTKCLGELGVPNIPSIVGNVIVTSIGHLANIMSLAKQYKGCQINEEYLLRESDTSMEFRELLVEDVSDALVAIAARCVHVDLVLKENGANAVKVTDSQDWEVSECTMREAMKLALEERNARLRGPAMQKVFIPRSVAALWCVDSTESEFIYDSYAEIGSALNRSGAKPVETIIVVGDGTGGHMKDSLPLNVFAGSKFAVALPQYGVISSVTIERARIEYEEFASGLQNTPAKVKSCIPKETALSYFHVNGSEPIRDGFMTIDRFKRTQFIRALATEVKNEAGIEWKTATMAGSALRDEEVVHHNHNEGFGFQGTRQGHARGGRGGRGQGMIYRGRGRGRGRGAQLEQDFLHRTIRGGTH